MGQQLPVAPGCTIDEDELEWRFAPSGGPGGQHANKAATRAEVTFDIAGSPSLSSTQRSRLLNKIGPTITVGAEDERSQTRNRQLALDRLRSRLADALFVEKRRRPTKATRGSKKRRMDAKTQRGQTKRLRGRVRGDDA